MNDGKSSLSNNVLKPRAQKRQISGKMQNHGS